MASELEEEEGLDLSEYWRITKRQKWGIIGLTLIVVLIGWLTALRSTPIYQAETKLLVEPVPPTAAMSENQMFEFSFVWLFYETQYEILKSRAIAKRVVDKLDLEKRERLAREAEKEQGIGSTAAWLPEWKEWVPEELRPVSSRSAAKKTLRTTLIDEIVTAIVVEGGQDSEIITLKYESDDAQEAADVVNAVADAYIEFGLESRLSTAKKTSSWLSGRLADLRSKLEESETAIEVFQKREGMVDTDNRERIVGSKMATLTAELIKAQTQRSEAEARHNQVQKIKRSGKGFEALITMIHNPVVTSLQEKKLDLEQEVAELSERYGEKHPKMIAVRADLKEAGRRFRSEINKAVESVRKEYEVALHQERQLRRATARQKSEMRELTGKAFQLGKLERDVESNRQLYEIFLTRFKEMDVSGENDVTNVRIVDRAEVPTEPIKPNMSRIVAISLVLGVMLGMAFAFLREHLDKSFRIKEDIEGQLRLPVLGAVPKLKLGRKSKEPIERYVLLEPRSPFAEAINDVRTGIMFAHIDKPAHIILVTSSIPGEGKSTLASNLALSFRQRSRTLLIEADLRKSRLSHLYDLKGMPGLSNLVAADHPLKDCMFEHQEAKGLYIMCAGGTPPNPLEVLSSRSFTRTLESLRKHFDYIIIDGPPVLPVSDSLVLSHLADAVVLAVQSDKTTHALAQDAVKRLMAAHVTPVGAVLTQVDMGRQRSYYTSQYKHYYDGYYQYEEPENKTTTG
ncbi:MAG: polysaccharide biosynthesis tyrosine autokinase [Gammaproteobacteria bacterium]|nr:polysaccharide biosynthesis tyrosine autokinase [Gammaproteobacteria bacterium]